MEKKKYNRYDAISLLRNKQRELELTGIARYPKRDDFEIEQVQAIKAFLGPWPRALETAGIKPVRNNVDKTGEE